MSQVKNALISRQGLLRGAFGAATGVVLSCNSATAMPVSGSTSYSPAPKNAYGTTAVLLGTAAGPFVRAQRSEPSTLIIADGTPYIFDIGYGCLSQLEKCGYSVRDLGAIFITHQHTDHNIDLPSIINFCWSARRETPLPLIGPPGTVRLYQAALAYFREAARVFLEELPSAQLPDIFRVSEIDRDGPAFANGSIKVNAMTNTHFQTFDAGADRSFSYRIEARDRTITITGDTGPDLRLAELARNSDLLISEIIDVAGTTAATIGKLKLSPQATQAMARHMALEHLPPLDLAALANAANVKAIALTHISTGADDARSAELLAAQVRQHFHGPVFVGADLMRL